MVKTRVVLMVGIMLCLLFLLFNLAILFLKKSSGFQIDQMLVPLMLTVAITVQVVAMSFQLRRKSYLSLATGISTMLAVVISASVASIYFTNEPKFTSYTFSVAGEGLICLITSIVAFLMFLHEKKVGSK